MRNALIVLLTFTLPLAASLRTDLDSFAKKAMIEVGANPGVAIVVVKDGAIVYQRELGWADVDAKRPADRETRFYMASSTKALTAMAAVILAEEGKLDLDAPIATVWPELKLTAPLDPKTISLRDLLAMRSGIGNDTANFRMEIGNLTDDAELMRVLATYSHQDPRTFRYSNLNYILAARVMEKATGKPWTELVHDLVLQPLGMNATSVAQNNAAKCYRVLDKGKFAETPAEIAFAGAAGAMLTSSDDAAKWMIAMLQQRGLPKRAIRAVQSEQTTNRRRFRYIDRFAWGFGQDLGEYEGELIVHRFGGLNGAYAHISFMPERAIGVAVFANGTGAVPDAIAAYAYDTLLGKKDRDAKWEAEVTKLAKGVEKRNTQVATKPASRPLDVYAALYHYDRLGDIRVTAEGEHLYAQLGIYRAELLSKGDDAFVIDWIGQGDYAPIQFKLDGGKVTRLDWGGRVFERQ